MIGDVSFALPLGEAKFGLYGGYVEGGERPTPTTDGGKLSFSPELLDRFLDLKKNSPAPLIMYIDEILFVIGCFTVTSRCTWPFPYSISRGSGELFRDGMLTSVFWKFLSLVNR
jgi:hypothetical protein